MTPDNSPANLIAEQFAHAVDLLKADLAQIRSTQSHDRELILTRLTSTEAHQNDMETRLRAATEGVTTFKAWASFITLVSALLSIIAIVRSFFQ